METLSSFIITITSLLIGYFLGKNQNITIQSITETIKQKIDRSPVGVIKRPTQSDILKRTDPLERKLEEGKDAMRETLKIIKNLE